MRFCFLFCLLTSIYLGAQEEYCPPIYPNEQSMSPGYNIATRIEVDRYRDIYSTFSALYWVVSQSNMELGIISNFSDPEFFLKGEMAKLGIEYQPGFKLGIGTNLQKDGWDIFFEYTWLRSTVSTSVSLNPGGFEILYPSWQLPDVFVAYFHGDEKWRLTLDLLDFELGREYLVGCDLSFRPFVGIRAAIISQTIQVNYSDVINSVFLPRNAVFVEQTSSSWGIGPRVGLDTKWDLGWGFRFFSDGALDILFTDYTKLKTFQKGMDITGSTLPSSLVSVNETNDMHLRTQLELDLGFGYGTYFLCNRWHVDVALGYQFQIFFDQNMFRSFVDDQTLGKADSPHGNLYMHGLTATLRLDY